MKTVTPLDLRRSLGRILDEASAGERFLIARDHHPLAVLISVEDAARLDGPDEEVRKRRQAAFAALEEFRRRIGPDPSGLSAAELIRLDRDALDRRDQRRGAGDLGASFDDP
jgi:antitoxin (DNA-binding transcriptional repressor) of toxin-antitoxin stability system